MLDRAGQAVIVALPDKENADMAEDRQLREFTCDPKQRKVLITDGKTTLGQALVREMAAAKAEIIWVGYAEPWKKFAGFDELEKIPQVTLVPLDVTDSKNVREVAAEIAGKVDIVVNNAEYHRSFGIGNRQGVETARAEMDVNYFGLLRLAQEFAPAMRSRGADGRASAVAWVNLLSIYALANFPPHGTFSASKAAAHSLAQCLRAEMRPAGVRVVNVFPGRSTTSGTSCCRRPSSPRQRSPRRSSARCATAWRMSIRATWPRNGLPAGAIIRRRWKESFRHDRATAIRGCFFERQDTGRRPDPDPVPRIPEHLAAAGDGTGMAVRIEEVSRYDERGPGLVLEQLLLRRAHRHAFRRAGALDLGQGPAE